MYFDHNNLRHAKERHTQLLAEARILRLIRAANAQPVQPPRAEPHPRLSLLARVFTQLRQRPSARA